MITHLPHDPRLSRLVLGYWHVEDLAGVHAGRPIATCPFPGAVLSVNLGRPNALVDGPAVPRVSLLGIQERSRAWRSWADTSFLMACLTPEGLAALFPCTGEYTVGTLIELGSVTGDRASNGLAADVSAAPNPAAAARCFDRWILGRLHDCPMRPQLALLSSARLKIALGASVDDAANAVGVTRRQLARWHGRHFGVGPSRLGQLARLQRSVREIQHGVSDGVAGFADQAHQIRTWRRVLGTTPGAYRRDSAALASMFEPGGSGLSFYL